MRFCARSFALICSTAAAEGRSTMRVFRCGGFRTAFTGFESIRRHSTARWRMPWRKARVFRTVGSPTPAAVRSARKLAMSSGVSSRSAIVPSRGGDVAIPELRVYPLRLGREVRNCVRLPPLLGEHSQRFAAAFERREVAGLLSPSDLGLEASGVSLAVERPRPISVGLPPSDPPDDGAGRSS